MTLYSVTLLTILIYTGLVAPSPFFSVVITFCLCSCHLNKSHCTSKFLTWVTLVGWLGAEAHESMLSPLCYHAPLDFI